MQNPSECWINKVRPAGIAKYSEEEWMDWETFLEEVAEQMSWAHPSWVGQHKNSWMIKGELYDMTEINWSMLGLLMKTRRYVPKSDRLTKYMVLYV